MTAALIVVDVQKDFCKGGALAVPHGDEVVPLINKMIAHARKRGWPIFFTFDWHPEDTEHFKENGGVWPKHCVQGTKGAEPHQDLAVCLKLYKSFMIAKGTKKKGDALSGFEGCTLDGKSLLEILISCGVTELYIGGLATDYCVKATALDARKYHLVTHLLVDACRAVNVNPDDGAHALVAMAKAGVMLSDVDEVCAQF
ncbi:MAG: isochorismatase family protein [Parcubacteria group bacterium]|nr:isochorismatase family protein [Parcubacteria group bacterium]